MLAFGSVADVLGLPAKEIAARSPFGLSRGSKRGYRSKRWTEWPVSWHRATHSSNIVWCLRRSMSGARQRSGCRRTKGPVWLESHASLAWISMSGRPKWRRVNFSFVVIQSEIGADLVMNILGSLKYGSAA